MGILKRNVTHKQSRLSLGNATHQRKTRKIRRGGNAFAVRYGSIIVGNQGLTRQQTYKQPEIMFEPQPGKQYALVMYDSDAPNPAYLHWFVVNITNPKQLVPLIQYEPPNPPSTDKHYHRYMFELLEQPGPIRISGLDRQGFQVHAFKKTHGLKIVASTGFYVMP
jgi:phosphatidylethanolamine-binding protein (PEBP) family uncharacterized protein